MSSVGVLPGFAYPELDYRNMEFFSAVVPVANSNPGGFASPVLVRGGGGDAYRIETIAMTLITSAIVGQRACYATVTDGDGHVLSQWLNPLSIGASTNNSWTWDTKLSNAYVLASGGAGYSPLQDLILLPGFVLKFDIIIQAGDAPQGAGVTGKRIGTLGTVTDIVPIPQPLIL